MEDVIRPAVRVMFPSSIGGVARHQQSEALSEPGAARARSLARSGAEVASTAVNLPAMARAEAQKAEGSMVVEGKREASDPSGGRAIRREVWRAWNLQLAKASERKRAAAPTIEERREAFRTVAEGFTEARQMARARKVSHTFGVDELREVAGEKQAKTELVFTSVAQKKRQLNTDFVARRFAKGEKDRNHDAIQSRRDGVRQLQSLAIRLRAQGRQDRGQDQRVRQGGLKQQAKRDQARTAHRSQQESSVLTKRLAVRDLQSPDTGSVSDPPPTSLRVSKPSLPVRAASDARAPSLLAKGGIKQLLSASLSSAVMAAQHQRERRQAFTGEAASVTRRDLRPGLPASSFPSLETREGAAEESFEPTRPMHLFSRSPSPVYLPRVAQLDDNAEVDGPADASPRQLRGEPVRLSVAELRGLSAKNRSMVPDEVVLVTS